MTIYGQIGGSSAVNAAVDLFYAKVLDDPSLSSYFDTIDLARLKGHQRAFITAAIGGPQAYAGRSMADAHAGLSITKEAFDSVVGKLVETLTELGVPDEVIGEIGARLLPLEHDIVSSKAPVG
jgi:hemoglobin